MTKPYPAGLKITSRICARHYDVNDVTNRQLNIVNARDAIPRKSPVGFLSSKISKVLFIKT